jgi:hypothetical protein
MQFQIKRFSSGSNEIVFNADIDATEETSQSVKLGLAVVAAHAVDADLSAADAAAACPLLAQSGHWADQSGVAALDPKRAFRLEPLPTRTCRLIDKP